MKIQLKDKLAKMPTRATPWDAGADLYSIDEGWLWAGEWKLFDTGVAIELPDSYVGFVCPRSGMAKRAISIVNAPGVVDSGYRGSIKVMLINLGEDAYHVSLGDKIAQLVIQQVAFPSFEIAESLSETVRGSNGFGSSGV